MIFLLMLLGTLIFSFIIFALKILSSIFIYLDAKQKNDDDMLWLIVSLLCGAIGILFMS